VASEFVITRWRSERRGCTGASNRWLSPWRAHRRSPHMHNASYCNMVRHRGTWCRVVRWLSLARMIPKRPWERWTRRPEWIVAGVYPRCDISYLSSLFIYTEHESPQRAWIRAHGCRQWGIWSWRSDPDIVPSHCLFSQSVRAICREIRSQIHVVTRPALCIKVVALWSSYKSTIATILNRAIDPTPIWPKSLANITGDLNSVIRGTDSTTLSSFYSNFYTALVLSHLIKFVLLS
jgi:hypothetical protein